MLTKKAYTLEELILYLEALEMLDMKYNIEKVQEQNRLEEGQSIPYYVWVINFTLGEPSQDSLPIMFDE